VGRTSLDPEAGSLIRNFKTLARLKTMKEVLTSLRIALSTSNSEQAVCNFFFALIEE
jgi:hypothetical protein